MKTSDGATGEEIARTLGNIINKSRLTRGWNEFEGSKLDNAVASWLEILLFNKIPRSAINLLYLRAQENAANAINTGREEPPITANALVAAWISGVREEFLAKQNVLLKQLKSGEVEREKCPKCFGGGFEIKRDGFYSGAVKCDHIPDFEPKEVKDLETEIEKIKTEIEIENGEEIF